LGCAHRFRPRYAGANLGHPSDSLGLLGIAEELLGHDGDRDGNGMGRHAGVGIARLVVQASLQNVLSWLRCQVGVKDELAAFGAN
jgi:hypothetical protein